MPYDPRLAKFESDVQHLQSDATEIKADFKLLRERHRCADRRNSCRSRPTSRGEFGSVRTSIRAGEAMDGDHTYPGAGTILSVWGARARPWPDFLKS